jgi:hypothetical protein
MTDKATKKGGAPRVLAQMGASPKGPSQASGARGSARRGRQPEPTPSFTKSPPQFPPLSSRGHPPVAIHCAPRNESTNPERFTSRHDGLPRQTEVFLAMTEHVVIARAQPVAIHCEPGSEPTKPDTRTSRHDGLPRPFVPRNDNVVSQDTTDIFSPLRVIASAQPVAIHCEQGSEPNAHYLSSRGHPPVAIHCAPISEPTKPERNLC